jgi:hypothetical protein
VTGSRSRSRKITRAEGKRKRKRKRKRNLTKLKKITPGKNERVQGFSKDCRSILFHI